ncbi:hypothetical protein PRIPAC_86672, partial [Pristionchus pacificus]
GTVVMATTPTKDGKAPPDKPATTPHSDGKDGSKKPSDKSTTPHKDRDGVHVKELGRDFLKLFKRKKKTDGAHTPTSPMSDTQRADQSEKSTKNTKASSGLHTAHS